MLQNPPPVVADFLNVGFGQSTVLRPAEGGSPVIVIDGGDDRAAFYARPQRLPLADYLRQHGISTIDCMVATHPHRDHVGGLRDALEACRVKKLITPYDLSVRGAWASSLLEDNIAMGLTRQHLLLQEARRQGCEVCILHGAHTLELPPVSLHFYPLPDSLMLPLFAEIRACCAQQDAPDIAARLRALDLSLNAGSQCLRAEIYGHALLFTTDQPLSYWDTVAEEALRADVLTGLHHGDLSRLSSDFLQKAAAPLAVISADTQGMYGLPSPGFAQTLAQSGVRAVFAAGEQSEDTACCARLTLRPGAPISVSHLQTQY